EFSIERCQAYEAALRLPALDLVDCYLYACRLQNNIPRTCLARIREPSGTELDLIWRLGQGDRLQALEWLRLAYLYRNRPDVFSTPRTKEGLLLGLARQAGYCFEKEERLAREALIIAGASVLPVLREQITKDPLRYFNTCEVAGFIPGQSGSTFLSTLFEETQDGALAATILEPLRRHMQNREAGPVALKGLTPLVREYAVSVLERPDEFYTAREESLAILSSGAFLLSPREKARLGHVREDLRQLRVDFPVKYRKELINEVVKRFATEVESSPSYPEGAPLRVPGLHRLIDDGLFASERIERLACPILLRPWQLSDVLGRVLGAEIVRTVQHEHYGLQRAGVRYLTKLMHPECLDPIRQLGWSTTLDDSVRLTLAWALGSGDPKRDADLLVHLCRTAATTSTRRVVALAATRLGATSVLEELARGKDSEAALEARRLSCAA
ncbi:MAG: hypothetical protein JO362_04935, partial [Streptomycetaceae bacterium]|nr:hypothetical protein [Streptomycetaceae bacterium]